MPRMVRFGMFLSEDEHAAFAREADGGHPSVASWVRGACNERVKRHESRLPRSPDVPRPARFEMRLDELEHARYLVEVAEEQRESLAEWVRDVCNARLRRPSRRAAG